MSDLESEDSCQVQKREVSKLSSRIHGVFRFPFAFFSSPWNFLSNFKRNGISARSQQDCKSANLLLRFLKKLYFETLW